MHTASLQATIAGTLQDFMVLARDDQLDQHVAHGEDAVGGGQQRWDAWNAKKGMTQVR
jgi:hypothetical protein